MSTRAFVSCRPPRQNRRLCDELGVIQAALLMAGCDPSSDAGYIEGDVWFKLREIARTPDVGDTLPPEHGHLPRRAEMGGTESQRAATVVEADPAFIADR